MGYAVLHIDKSKATSSGSLGNHIDRKFTPENADEKKKKLNLFFDPGTNKLSQEKPKEILTKRIENRIKAGYTAPRKIKSNAVRSINFILSGTHEDMVKICANPTTKENWLKMNVAFLAEQFGGKENIVGFALHMDEHTPHVHATVVPITDDGRLSARDFMYGRARMRELQDLYAAKMKDFGLQRGIKGSKAKHTTTAEFYKTIESSADIKISGKDIKNMTVEEKAEAFDILVALKKKNALERKKTTKVDKTFRNKINKQKPRI